MVHIKRSVFADVVSILGGNIHESNTRKNTKALLIPSKVSGLEVNAGKIKYMIICRNQNTRPNSKVNVGNKSFETMQQFKYFETTLTKQNCIHEEIKSRLKSGNACYHSVLNLLPSDLLYENVNIKYTELYCGLFFYGCETWLLTLREGGRPRVLENRVLRICGPKRDEVIGEWGKIHNKEL
jgi:hypothetical protein